MSLTLKKYSHNCLECKCRYCQHAYKQAKGIGAEICFDFCDRLCKGKGTMEDKDTTGEFACGDFKPMIRNQHSLDSQHEIDDGDLEKYTDWDEEGNFGD